MKYRVTKKEKELMLYKTMQSIYAELKAIRIHLEPQSKNNNMTVAKSGRLVGSPIISDEYDSLVVNH